MNYRLGMGGFMDCRIISNKQVGPDYYLMELSIVDSSYNITPGQFVNIKIGKDLILRRPFSIHDYDKDAGILNILYRLVGKGTERLSSYKSGVSIDVLGPLGNGFSKKLTNKKILIIGGGMGGAPLYYLAKSVTLNNKVTVLIGGKDEADIIYYNKIFTDLPVEFGISTVDGSAGYKGNVLSLWQEQYNIKYDFVYSCGPEGMLREVQKISQILDILGEISLEKRMGCGYGVCLSCVCQTSTGNLRTCKEGPIFPIDGVIFND